MKLIKEELREALITEVKTNKSQAYRFHGAERELYKEILMDFYSKAKKILEEMGK